MKSVRIFNKKNFYLVLVFLILFSISFKSNTYAADREHLKETLEQQEQQLGEEMKPLAPEKLDRSFFESLSDQILEREYTGEFNASKLVIALQTFVYTIFIKLRTYTILLYSVGLVICLFYMAVMGSRDANKRRKSYLFIRNTSVLFFIYINVPLFIIWLGTDKSKLLNLSIFNIVLDIIEFMQSNSVVISSLLLYAGVTRLIISRNDLPVRMQGRYLIKFAFILLVFLNLAPIAIEFLM
ncbi:MAG: hypothetical protein ACLS2V_12985 [Clostridium paraputrificum]|uniref:hypothetical protein n=1 Tax=Clostridium sp. TaxID=1506 RepID=UPI0025B7AA20|nr:hypothetical protein [Clostridium sp.]MBS5926216.1 hypothetical protein [Clostridium sp.]